jgi:hypothetical protein
VAFCALTALTMYFILGGPTPMPSLSELPCEDYCGL